VIDVTTPIAAAHRLLVLLDGTGSTVLRRSEWVKPQNRTRVPNYSVRLLERRGNVGFAVKVNETRGIGLNRNQLVRLQAASISHEEKRLGAKKRWRVLSRHRFLRKAFGADAKTGIVQRIASGIRRPRCS